VDTLGSGVLIGGLVLGSMQVSPRRKPRAEESDDETDA
jgi:hypothetical protein